MPQSTQRHTKSPCVTTHILESAEERIRGREGHSCPGKCRRRASQDMERTQLSKGYSPTGVWRVQDGQTSQGHGKNPSKQRTHHPEGGTCCMVIQKKVTKSNN